MPLRRKEVTELLDAINTDPDETRCGRKADGINFRLSCDLPRGHVKTAADWHEAHATTTGDLTAADFTHHTEHGETLRWQPDKFEIPDPKPAAP